MTQKQKNLKQTTKNEILVGDKFFFNSFSVRKGLSLPDYLIVTNKQSGFVNAYYENRGVGIRDRKFSEINLWRNSNLNPEAKNPKWVFLKNVE